MNLISVCEEFSDNDLTIFAIICFTFACCHREDPLTTAALISTERGSYTFTWDWNSRTEGFVFSYRHGHNLTSTISFLLHWAKLKGKFVVLTVKFKLNYTCCDIYWNIYTASSYRLYNAVSKTPIMSTTAESKTFVVYYNYLCVTLSSKVITQFCLNETFQNLPVDIIERFH